MQSPQTRKVGFVDSQKLSQMMTLPACDEGSKLPQIQLVGIGG